MSVFERALSYVRSNSASTFEKVFNLNLVMKSESKNKSTLDKMLENNIDKKNALKKIINELNKNEKLNSKSK